MPEEKISGTQIGMMIFMTILPTMILFVPQVITQEAGESAWLTLLLIPPAFGYIVLLILAKLEQLFPGKTLPQYSELLLGKILGKLVTVVIWIAFLFWNVLVIRQFADFMTVSFYPQTPAAAITSILMIVAIYAAWNGVEVIARMTQFVLPLFLSSFIFIQLLLIPEMELGYLLPFMENGIVPILQSSILPAVWFGETVILAVLLPYVNKPQEVKRKGLIALAVSAVLLSVETIVIITVLGPELTATFTLPTFETIRYIEYRYYVQRLEPLIAAFWTASTMLKASIVHSITCIVTQQLFGLKSSNTLNIPLAVFQVVVASLAFNTGEELMEFLNAIALLIVGLLELGIPAVLLGIALIKNKLKANRLKSSS